MCIKTDIEEKEYNKLKKKNITNSMCPPHEEDICLTA
jgi:hypothetical protein